MADRQVRETRGFVWTTPVAFLTPLFTEMLTERYDFDLGRTTR